MCLLLCYIKYVCIPRSFLVMNVFIQGETLGSPCVIPNYSQQDATFLGLFIFTDALHVSGGYSAHHQEHITVHTASGIVNQYCC